MPNTSSSAADIVRSHGIKPIMYQAPCTEIEIGPISLQHIDIEGRFKLQLTCKKTMCECVLRNIVSCSMF